jgi:protoporphyrinogen oxidase
MQDKTIVLGAGVAGLGAAYALRSQGQHSFILERDNTYGGLCGCIEIDGFRFDRFVHLSFAKSERVNSLFLQTPVIRHIPNPSNIYNKVWIKHPAQNNLFPLPDAEKQIILRDFRRRKSAEEVAAQGEASYEDWLRCQFGDYFAEHFPMVYTRKYWMKEAHSLRTEWVGSRIYQPSMDEVIAGCEREDARVTYYAKEMRYPQRGGYKSFLAPLAEGADICYNANVVTIDPLRGELTCEDGKRYTFKRLISSLPLPEVVKMLPNVPSEVKEAAGKLEATRGYHISVALKGKRIPPYLWWYVYDEDILTARVHSPSLKSPDNAPEGCSSLQMEVYCDEGKYTEQELLDGTVGKLVELGVIHQEDILFTHIGFEKYANVIFTKPIYEARKVVRDYLLSVGIETIGRFGEWDYLWSDQSLLSGLNVNNNNNHQ